MYQELEMWKENQLHNKAIELMNGLNLEIFHIDIQIILQEPKLSDLLVNIFGDKGRHARFAVGSNALPLNISVEIDAIIKIK